VKTYCHKFKNLDLIMSLRRNNLGDGLAGILGENINRAVPVLGSTEAGSKFVMKALNPSWSGICTGMPDMTTGNVVIYKFEQLVQIDGIAHAGAADVCDYEINLYMDPIAPVDVIATTRALPGDISSSFTYLNSQLPNATATTVPPLPVPTGVRWTDTIAATDANYDVKRKAWLELAQHARGLYFGATLEQSAGTDSSQGWIRAGQTNQSPIMSVVVDPQLGQMIAQEEFEANDFASNTSLIQMPRAFSAQSTMGTYVPLKLPTEMVKWTSQVTPVATTSDLIGTVSGANGSKPSPHKHVAMTNGHRCVGSMNDNVGQIFLRGVASSTTYTIRLRYGFEVKPFANATNSPFIDESPMYDEIAMKAYSQIMLEVAYDAYPANYNLWEILGEAIKKIAPTLIDKGTKFLSNYGETDNREKDWLAAANQNILNAKKQALRNIQERMDMEEERYRETYGPAGGKRKRQATIRYEPADYENVD
jgi:hypothetical protein